MQFRLWCGGCIPGDGVPVSRLFSVLLTGGGACVKQAGRDYEPLREALRAGDFEKADDITREELIQLAGAGAVKRSWVYFTGELHASCHAYACCWMGRFVTGSDPILLT